MMTNELSVEDAIEVFKYMKRDVLEGSKEDKVLDMAIKALEQEQKTGKWEVIRKEYEFMGSVVNEPQGCKCSNCGAIVKFKSDFCPSCGADMREARENDRRRNNDE